MPEFVHLHTHSDFSILSGIADVNNLIKKAYQLNMPALALTDTGNMFGAMEFYTKTEKSHKSGNLALKPILGCEVYLAPKGMKQNTNKSKYGDAPFQLVLLCQDLEGYHNLIKLVSHSYTDGFFKGPRIDFDFLAEKSKGLIALSGGFKGEIAQAMQTGGLKEAEKAAARYKDLFGADRFYLELQDHGLAEEKNLQIELLKLAQKLDLQYVATNDVFYLDPEDSFAHEIFLCIESGARINWEKGVGKEKRPFLPGTGYHMKSAVEMHQSFKEIPRALSNTLKISEMCNLTFPKPEPHMPLFDIPDSSSPIDYLRKISYQGLKEKKPDFDEQYTKRLEYELSMIGDMGFPTYFLIVADFINNAKQTGIVGPGRGSAAGSLVSYATGITNLDPIKYGLLFERFLNPERVNLPDVDIDFQDNKRADVLKYVRNKYGRDKNCQIITYGKLKAKAVFKDVARVFDVHFEVANKISSLIGSAKSLKDAYQNNLEFKDAIQSDAIFQEVYRHSLKLEGLTRQTGIHAAGVIISDKAVEEYAPIYADAEGTICTQYEGTVLEKHCGLIKMDFLGLRNLTIIDETVKLIKETTSEDIDIETIPMDDAETFKLAARGNTLGVFQFESAGMRKYLKSLKPNSIHDLIAMNAMYRPGPLSWIPVYIDKKHNRKPEFDTPEREADFKQLESLVSKNETLRAILAPTNLIPIYQEQIMQIGQEYAGFTLGEADLMRRAIGKKEIAVLEKVKEQFLSGAEKLDGTRNDAEFLYEKIIMPFAGYGFNKSHAACYALIAYQTAYLKSNYACCFMTALLNSEIENTDKIKLYIDDCKQLGVDILPACINTSQLHFSIKDGKILYGLAAIKGVASAAGSIIEHMRKNGGPFKSFFDFLRRIETTKLNKQVIEQLIKAGVFDEFKLDSEKLLAVYPEMAVRIEQEARLKLGGQTTFFEDSAGADPDPENKDTDIIDKALQVESTPATLKSNEKEALGFNIKHDPLARYRKEFSRLSTYNPAAKDSWPDNQAIKLAGAISSIRNIVTKKGDQMAFLGFDNGQGTVDVVVFPKLYKKINEDNAELLSTENLVMIKGKTQNNQKGVSVLADEIELFDAEKIPKSIYSNLHIQFSDEKLKKTQLAELKDILYQHYGGTCRVFLHFFLTGKPTTVLKAGDSLTILPSKLLETRLEKTQFISRYWFN